MVVRNVCSKVSYLNLWLRLSVIGDTVTYAKEFPTVVISVLSVVQFGALPCVMFRFQLRLIYAVGSLSLSTWTVRRRLTVSYDILSTLVGRV